jgi:hypothetical protein
MPLGEALGVALGRGPAAPCNAFCLLLSRGLLTLEPTEVLPFQSPWAHIAPPPLPPSSCLGHALDHSGVPHDALRMSQKNYRKITGSLYCDTTPCCNFPAFFQPHEEAPTTPPRRPQGTPLTPQGRPRTPLGGLEPPERPLGHALDHSASPKRAQKCAPFPPPPDGLPLIFTSRGVWPQV